MDMICIMSDDRSGDELALRRLAGLYAKGADRGDGEMFAGVFLSGARLRVYRLPDLERPSTDLTGHEALSHVPSSLSGRFARTFHFLGQCTYEIGDGEASGEVYCLAHHLSADRDGRTDYVMHMRYLDDYRRDEAGEWRIAERTAHVDWTETRPANPAGR